MLVLVLVLVLVLSEAVLVIVNDSVVPTFDYVEESMKVRGLGARAPSQATEHDCKIMIACLSGASIPSVVVK